jgi:YD repeat-containing protein
MYLWNGYDMAPKNYRMWDGSAWVSQSDIITRNTDFGNILETEDGNDMRTTTRWDSSGLPIATVQNAEHEECSYLNFEGGDLLDGWSKTASASITSDMYFTGSAAFSAANGYWALANDWYDEGSNEDREYDSNKKYKVSVWVYLTNAADIGQTILGIGSHPTGYGADYGSATKAKQWELVTAECDASSILNDEVMRVWIAAKYCSGTVYFDDLRVYPSDAIMETTVYEPCTGTVLAKADPNNMPVIYDYDPYLRLVRTRNADGKLLTSTQHYYSRDVRENFLNTDPNYYRTITLTSANGYSNFAGSDGWTTSGSVLFGEYYNGETTVKLTDSGSSASIYKATGTGDKIARVDFYTNNTGTPNVIGFDGSGYLFYIDYLTSTNQFRIRTQSSNTTFSDLTVEDGLWYTAEIEKRANGTCLAWVYPKGESRNSANKLSATGYPGNWNPIVKSKMDDTGSIYLANHYVGDFAEEAVFTDGLGREFQRQVRDGDYDVITKNTFNKIGKTHQQYKPARISNASHNFFGLSSDSLKQTYTYTSDALKRIHQFFHYDNDDTVTTTFDSENLNGVNCNYTQKVDEKNLTQRIYTNKFGNEICQRHAIGTTDSTRLFKKYDILGNLIQVNTPNYYRPRSGTDSTDFKITMQYDMLGNLTQKTTPDDGITKFHYDKNKNLRFVQNDEQRNSYDFTVYHYDELSRVILIGEETDDYNWSTTAPSDTNTTFGTEASEWRIKKYYDENYVSGAENFCQGKLTKVEINQDSDNSAEYSFKYVYDQQGNLVEKRIIDDSGSSLSEKTIKYEYDHLGRKSAVSYPSGSVVNQDYNQVGQLEKLFTVE